jgi:ribosomal protein S6
MRKYEIAIIAKSAEGLEERVEKLVKAVGGKVTKFSPMGKKQLAYQIGDVMAGEYFDIMVELPAPSVVQLDTKLTIEGQKKNILRHLLVRVEK